MLKQNKINKKKKQQFTGQHFKSNYTSVCEVVNFGTEIQKSLKSYEDLFIISNVLFFSWFGKKIKSITNIKHVTNINQFSFFKI